MLNIAFLSLRWFIRDLKVKEWNSVLITLVLCITCIHTFEWVSDRLIRGIQHQSAAFLGGDLLISSSTPPPKNWVKKAESLHLKTAEAWSYLSMLSIGERLQLVNVYAVSETFPLYGKPIQWAAFKLYIEPKILAASDTPTIRTVRLGSKNFTVHRAQPNDFRFTNGIPFAPFVSVRMDDVRQTNTIASGSRLEYLLFLKGDENNIKQFQNWLQPQLTLSQKMIDPHNNQGVTLNLMTRFNDYLRFTLLIIIALSSISISLSFSHKQSRLLDKFALWLALGATKKMIRCVIGLQFVFVFLLSNVIAASIAFFLQKYALITLEKYLNLKAAPLSISPLVVGIMTSIILLLGMIIPTVLLIKNRKSGDLWRNSPQQLMGIMQSIPIILLINLIGFQLLHAHYSALNTMMTGGLIFIFGFIALFTGLLLRYLAWLSNRLTGHWRFALKQFSSHAGLTTLHLTSLIFALFPILFLFLVKGNIIQDWMHQLPSTTPNYYLFNLSKIDLPKLTDMMNKNHIPLDTIYPMVKGRLTALNDQPILQVVPENGRDHAALKRELNLSSMIVYPSDNIIISGGKWSKTDANTPIISVEKSLAESLHLRLGDNLTFKIENDDIKATINNIRSVTWSSFHPNFFVIFTPGQLDRFPTTYITSFYLKNSNQSIIKSLNQAFPNATLIDISYMMKQVQQLMEQLIFILNHLFLFSILMAAVISWSCHLIIKQQRKESELTARTIGASPSFIKKSKWIEWSLLIGLVTLFSCGFSMLLYRAVFWFF